MRNYKNSILQIFKHYPGLKRYSINSGWLIFESIIRIVISLAVGILLIRYLGPGQFGKLSYAFSFVGLFTAIALLGLDSIVVREVVSAPGRSDELLGTAFWLKIPGSILAISIIAVAVHITNNSREEQVLIYIISSGLIFRSFGVIDLYFQATVQSRQVVTAQLAKLFISSVVKLALIWFQAPLLWFACAAAFDGVVFSIGLVINYLRVGKSIALWRYKAHTARNLMRDSWPLIFSGIAITIYMKIDQVMIREMLDAKAVGHYAAAARLSEALYFVPVALASSLFPAIVNSRKTSHELYFQRLQKFYNMMVILAVAIALPATILSDWLVVLLFGDAYLQSGAILALHVWAGIFVFVGVVDGKVLAAENLQIIHMIRTAIGCFANIALNLLLIPLYGIQGAAFSTVISYAIAAYLTIPLFSSQRTNFLLITRAILTIGMSGWRNEKTN